MRKGLTALAFMLGLTAAAAQTTDANRVDLELVLAVDISYSMDGDELALQRDGYIRAITSKEVVNAIRQGAYGRIALTYVEWAGQAQQAVLIPWQVVDSPESAQAFADKLAEAPTNRAYRTAIGAALDFAAKQFEKSPLDSTRRVIDISGDGPNNQGPAAPRIRDELVARGININGLPLILKEPNAWTLDVTNLEDYYRECVIGGPGAFVIAVETRERFAEAIRTKLVLEVSGLEPKPRFIPAQEKKQVNCYVGEQLWRDRYGDGQPDWQ